MALVSWPAELHGGLVRGGISCVAAEVSFRGPTCIDDNSHGLLRVADGAASQQQVLFVKRVSPAASMDSVRWEEAWEWQPKDHSYTQVRNTERNKITGPNTTSIFNQSLLSPHLSRGVSTNSLWYWSSYQAAPPPPLTLKLKVILWGRCWAFNVSINPITKSRITSTLV